MAHKTGKMGQHRDFGMRGGPGKGSKTRVTDNKTFKENYDAIDWGAVHQSIKGRYIACGADFYTEKSTPICADVTCRKCRAEVGKLVDCVFEPL